MGKIEIPETGYRDSLVEGGGREDEYAPLISGCKERLAEFKANFALFQLWSEIQERFKGRIDEYEIDTRDKIIGYNDPDNDRVAVFVQKGITWEIHTFQNVAIRPQPEGSKPYLHVNQTKFLELTPGVRIHQLELQTPEKKKGDEAKQVFGSEEGGISRWQVEDPWEWGLSDFGRSPGMSVVWAHVWAATDGSLLETDYSLTATLMDRSFSFKYSSKKPIESNRDLLLEISQSISKEHHGLQEWIEELAKNRIWIPRSYRGNAFKREHILMI